MENKTQKHDKDLADPSLYFNRELSWLEFNDRVLEEAQDRTNPLLERLKFLAISASNLDEFFMVRYSSVFDLVDQNITIADASGMTPKRQLEAMTARAKAMSFRQYQTLKTRIIKGLDGLGIRFTDYSALDKSGRDAVEDYFIETVSPVLTPMAIDQSRPFPLLPNKSISLIVELGGEDDLFAVVTVPAVLPRFFEVPGRGEARVFIALEDVIKPFVKTLFNGYPVISVCAFRVTRDSDLEIDEEEADDIMDEIEKSIQRRKWGLPMRLEIESEMAKESRAFLLESLEIDQSRLVECRGYLDLTAFFAICGLKGYENLKYPPMPSVQNADLIDEDADIFALIRKKDILIHRPYQSFDTFLKFINRATDDPKVLAIKQTIYRVGKDSPVLNALMRAAKNGKQVTVLMELKARFDEENNIKWARKLELAGCHVVYGLVGLKAHCKLCLIIRREDDGIRRYVHLGTGNYNAETAKIYTDLGLITCRDRLARDISTLFNTLTGYSINLTWNKVAAAPTALRQTFINLIETEKKNALEGKPAGIIAKMNSLVDTRVIRALYKASAAGVPIKLIVRGICCLKPGVIGFSENITVGSVVGRFLEHSRIFRFENAGEPITLLSSADWMPRNFDRRVEIAFPIEDEDLRARIKDILDVTLSDNTKLRLLKSDGTYVKPDKRGKKPVNAQTALYEQACADFKEALKPEVGAVFKPIYTHNDSDF